MVRYVLCWDNRCQGIFDDKATSIAVLQSHSQQWGGTLSIEESADDCVDGQLIAAVHSCRRQMDATVVCCVIK